MQPARRNSKKMSGLWFEEEKKGETKKKEERERKGKKVSNHGQQMEKKICCCHGHALSPKQRKLKMNTFENDFTSQVIWQVQYMLGGQ